jgi:Zn-dependent protease with chaperone function
MDFFQNQEAARKKTGLLIAYFALAVALIIASVYLAIAAVLAWAGASDRSGAPASLVSLWDPQLFAAVAAGTAALISGGSLYKIASLSGGGHTVAELLGGRLLHSETADPDERKVLNVVEEMAIAAGTPVLPVYLLEGEDGINAFAAGNSPNDSVVAVTRGCVRNLSRDELQGVVAHEFSHILNGDMRLNLRLMGVLFGILLLGLTGYILLRSSRGVSVGSDDRDDRRQGNLLPLIGLALYVIGYVGVFFANLIKAAVSRQREFLADASAVQFTRNADGIAGALKKIGALSEGSTVRQPRAEEASHMFFGNIGGAGQLFGLLATHPPLVERIRRIEPSFDGDFSKIRLGPPGEPSEAESEAPARRPRPRSFPFYPAEAVARVGTVAAPQLLYAAGLLKDLPRTLTEQVRDPLGAQATVFALLLDPRDDVARKQLAWLGRHAHPAVVRQMRTLVPDVWKLAPEERLPLVELAVPALRQMTPAQLRDFLAGVAALVQADREVSIFEFALQQLLLRHLVTCFVDRGRKQPKYTIVAPLVEPTSIVLSALARAGASSPEAANQAFVAGVTALDWPSVRLEPSMDETTDLSRLDAALRTLDAASQPLKKQLLLACAVCVGADGRLTVEEGELLRAISDAIDCPMPPLIDHREPGSPPPDRLARHGDQR